MSALRYSLSRTCLVYKLIEKYWKKKCFELVLIWDIWICCIILQIFNHCLGFFVEQVVVTKLRDRSSSCTLFSELGSIDQVLLCFLFPIFLSWIWESGCSTNRAILVDLKLSCWLLQVNYIQFYSPENFQFGFELNCLVWFILIGVFGPRSDVGVF